jgi:hypothetical protein
MDLFRRPLQGSACLDAWANVRRATFGHRLDLGSQPCLYDAAWVRGARDLVDVRLDFGDALARGIEGKTFRRLDHRSCALMPPGGKLTSQSSRRRKPLHRLLRNPVARPSSWSTSPVMRLMGAAPHTGGSRY